MDAFFASVEQRNHPEYRGKPLIVAGAPEKEAEVITEDVVAAHLQELIDSGMLMSFTLYQGGKPAGIMNFFFKLHFVLDFKLRKKEKSVFILSTDLFIYLFV